MILIIVTYLCHYNVFNMCDMVFLWANFEIFREKTNCFLSITNTIGPFNVSCTYMEI